MVALSVIVPVYNTEKYLRECLDSIINQTFRDIEIICVNDGSTDKSLEILKEYAKQDTRIKIINKKNEGAAAARNDGIKIANGDFVCFMDSDDYYPFIDILEEITYQAKKNGVNICGGEIARFTDNNRTLTQNFRDTFSGYLVPENKLIKYSDYQFDYGFTRFIYNRNFLIDNAIFFPNYTRFEDPPFMVKAMLQAEKFYALNKITYAYREEYKKVNWTKEKTQDLLYGILTNMKIATKFNLSMLADYSYQRLEQHWEFISPSIDYKCRTILKEIDTYYPAIKNLYWKKLLKNLLKNIFSIRNDNRKTHKIITILGLKIKFKRRKN